MEKNDKRSGKEISANKQKQQDVSYDVVLTGFPLSAKLDSSDIVAKFFKILDLPNSAKNSSQFESKDSKTVSITCKDKQSQIVILEKAHHLRASDFITLQDENQNDKIDCQRRLSKFNTTAFKELMRYQSSKTIEEIRFEGLFYHYKQIGQSKWKEVSHKDILDSLKAT